MRKQTRWSAVWKIIVPRKWTIIFLALTTLSAALLEAGFLVLTAKTAFAIAEGSKHFELLSIEEIGLKTAIIISALAIAVRLLIDIASAKISSFLVKDFSLQTRKLLGNAFLDSRWSLQQQEPSGQLQHLLMSFTLQGSLLMQSLNYGLTALVTLLTLLSASITIDPFSTTLVLGALTILALVISPLRKKLNIEAEKAAEAELEFANNISEITSISLEISTFGVRNKIKEKIDNLAEKESEIRRKVNTISLTATPVYVALAYGFVLGSLAIIILMEIGELKSIGAIMLMMLRSLSYGQQLQHSMATVAEKAPFLDLLESTLSRYKKGKVLSGPISIQPEGNIIFENVSFSFTSKEKILTDLTFEINQGETIGIIGESGVGKTTLIHLLARLQTPDIGTIKIDKTNIDDFSLQSWSQFIAFVPQETELIKGNFKSNVEFFRSHIDENAVKKALKNSQLEKDLQTSDKKIEKEIFEDGSNLSGGQKQRIAIARALAGNPQLLILDEPTSALDQESENSILKVLQDLDKKVTKIVVTHRSSTLSICDRIIILDKGTILAFDTPAKLINSGQLEQIQFNDSR